MISQWLGHYKYNLFLYLHHWFKSYDNLTFGVSRSLFCLTYIYWLYPYQDKTRNIPWHIALCPRELPNAKGYIWMYIQSWVLIETAYNFQESLWLLFVMPSYISLYTPLCKIREVLHTIKYTFPRGINWMYHFLTGILYLYCDKRRNIWWNIAWARGKSRGQSLGDFPRAQAIFHCISWLKSQYRHSNLNPALTFLGDSLFFSDSWAIQEIIIQ